MRLPVLTVMTVRTVTVVTMTYCWVYRGRETVGVMTKIFFLELLGSGELTHVTVETRRLTNSDETDENISMSMSARVGMVG